MKTHSTAQTLLAIILAATTDCLQSLAAGTNATPERIGIYDSRVIAYAEFWSEAHQRRLNDLVKAAREAKAARQTDRFRELDAAIRAENERNHLQVFSTALVDDLLAGMKERVAAIQKTARVSVVVSRWDTRTLQAHPRAERVDVTDQLLGAFKLTDQQRRIVEEIRRKEPLPLDKAARLIREGKL